MRDKCRGMVFTAAQVGAAACPVLACRIRMPWQSRACGQPPGFHLLLRPQIALTTDVLARDSSLHPVWPLFAHRLPQLAATLLAPSHWRQLRCPEGCTDSVRERLWAFVVHPEGETRLLPRLERYRPDLLHGDGCVSRGSGNTASLASSNDCGGSGKGGTADTCAGNEGTSSNGEEAASGDGSRGTTLDSNGTAGCADDPTGSLSPPPTADFIDLTLTDSGDEAGGAAQGSARVTWHRLPLAPLQEHQRVQQGGQQQKLEDMHCPLEEQQQQQLQATSFGSTQRSGGRGGGQCKVRASATPGPSFLCRAFINPAERLSL
jgi:hypothetical protein